MNVCIEEIMKKIREEKSSQSSPVDEGHALFLPDSLIILDQIKNSLDKAQEFSAVGRRMPAFVGYRGLKLMMAKIITKILFHFLKIITNPQKMYNETIIQGMREVALGYRLLIDKVEVLLGIENTTFYTLSEKYNTMAEKIESLRNEFEDIKSEMEHSKLHLMNRERIVTSLLEEIKKNKAKPTHHVQKDAAVKEDEHMLDAMYVAFENRFRGTRKEIIEKQRRYLPYIRNALNDHKEYPVLDIGCGRGEWLELLGETGIEAMGVDINRVMVQHCRDLKLVAIEGDGIEYLRKQKADSLGAVTGFHIVEHMDLRSLIEFVDESLRVLISGGIVIFETPNPENLNVGACNFYIDPTHKNPIPPLTLEFLLGTRGFSNIKTSRLHPMKTFDPKIDADIQEIASRFYMAQDYSVIGMKS
jgi:O-antigen chain-terminating methyltransferase